MSFLGYRSFRLQSSSSSKRMLFIATQIGEEHAIWHAPSSNTKGPSNTTIHVHGPSSPSRYKEILYLGFIKRYKRRAGNSPQLKEAELRLSQFDARSFFPHTFEDYINERRVAFNILGLFYEDIVFRKWRRLTEIGARRDYTKLAKILEEYTGPGWL